MINCFFDLETTGLDPKEHTIIDAYFGFEAKGAIVAEWSGHIQPMPGRVIDSKALEANKRTMESLGQGMLPGIACSEIKGQFMRFVSPRDRGTKVTLIGYNSASFDIPFFKDWSIANGWHDFYKYFSWPGIDVAILAEDYLGEQWPHLSRWRLKEVSERFGLTYDESRGHGAKYDALLTRDLYHRISTLRKK